MPIQLNLCWAFVFCFFKNIFMCSKYFGKFLAKKRSLLELFKCTDCKTNAQRVCQEFFNVLALVCFLQYFWLNQWHNLLLPVYEIEKIGRKTL